MIRRLVTPVLAALVLACVSFLAPPIYAQKQADKARPQYLLCHWEDGKGNVKVFSIWIDWKKGLQVAVGECLAQGGHPVGVE